MTTGERRHWSTLIRKASIARLEGRTVEADRYRAEASHWVRVCKSRVPTTPKGTGAK